MQNIESPATLDDLWPCAYELCEDDHLPSEPVKPAAPADDSRFAGKGKLEGSMLLGSTGIIGFKNAGMGTAGATTLPPVIGPAISQSVGGCHSISCLSASSTSRRSSTQKLGAAAGSSSSLSTLITVGCDLVRMVVDAGKLAGVIVIVVAFGVFERFDDGCTFLQLHGRMNVSLKAELPVLGRERSALLFDFGILRFFASAAAAAAIRVELRESGAGL